MHLLDTLQSYLQWGFDHADNLYYIAMTCIVVRREITDVNEKEEAPTQNKASDKQKHKGKKR